MPGQTLRWLIFGLLTLTIGAFVSCASSKATPRQVSLSKVAGEEVSAPRSRGEPLRIAVSAMISPRETLEVYGEILNYVGEKMGRPVEFVQRKTYAEVNELVKTGGVDLAFVCTQAYVEGRQDFGMELLVAPRVKGEPVYYSYIIVPADSPVTSLVELQGKTFAFVDPISNTGKLVPTYLLARKGLTPDSFFSSYVYTGGHSNSIKWVAWKLVDGAAVDSLVWDYWALTNPRYTSLTKIIYKSPPYGIPPVVVNPRLDPSLKEKLKEIFLKMDEEEQGRKIINKIMIDEFVLLEDSAYDSVREMLHYLRKQ